MGEHPLDLLPWRDNARQNLWSALRAKRLGGIRWRRSTASAPIPADFFSHESKFAVVLDDGGERDARRVAWIKARGWRVLRAHPAEVASAKACICDALRKACLRDAAAAGFDEGAVSFDDGPSMRLAGLVSAPI